MSRKTVGRTTRVVVLALGVLAGDVQADPTDLQIRGAWIRTPLPGVTAAAGYVTFVGASQRSDELVGASSPRAAAIEIHATSSKDGVLRMRPVERLPIPAGATVRLAPGGTHLMLMGLSAPLAGGESLPVTLTFERAGAVTVRFAVRD